MRTAVSTAIRPFLFSFTAVMLSACGTSNQGAEAPAPAKPVARASPAEVYAAASKALEACKDGEHYLAQCSEGPLAKMREAAAAGHVQAQYELGSKLLSWLYTKQAPDSSSVSERQAYVDALTLLALAIQGGHAPAQKALPAALVEALRTGMAPTERDENSFFSQLPSKWLVEAANAARKTK